MLWLDLFYGVSFCLKFVKSCIQISCSRNYSSCSIEVDDKTVVAVEDSNNKETQTSATEVVDEVCSNSEYELRSPDESKAKPKPAVENPKPPPLRDRSLGGIDYYTATYEDPSSDEYGY